MQTRLPKPIVISTLKKNRQGHRKVFLEAVKGYRKEALKRLESHIKQIKAGKLIPVGVYLSVPVDRTRDYDRVIEMVEQHQDTTILLTESDYANYMLDDWAWKREWMLSNASYSKTAKMNSDLGSDF